ncbi:GNAT family N-acetyltransferase [Fibrobacter intestinalis]|uniref:GNAT family N-acetyltransferase n=1 Tax=Fibrobacter intestinalis TaxID=28122 RepID=UPI000932483C|nr:GNAT family N-acetyltransferase [Fibrobacter intestinalis]
MRNAQLFDARRLWEIYAHYVKRTAIAFEYEVPSIEEFQKRMEITQRRYPYLVIQESNAIQGFAYAGKFIGRAAYDWSCETTIYLDPAATKCGFGRMLYQELECRLQKMGIRNLYACVATPEKNDEFLTTNSADFHLHLGFSIAGEFHQCGCKFGRWYNMLWMEKRIGNHPEKASPIIPYPELYEKSAVSL